MEKFVNFVKRNWVVILVWVVIVALAFLAIILICKKEAKIANLQKENAALTREYRTLQYRDSLLMEDYNALYAEDSICSAHNQELSRACDELRRKCDSLQAHPRVKTVVNPPKAKAKTTRPRPRIGGYPPLDW